MNRIKNRRGQGLVEYALIVGLLAVVSIAAMTYFSTVYNDKIMGSVNYTISNASDKIEQGLSKGGEEPPAPGGS